MNPPKRGTKKFKNIVSKGCGGYWTNTTNGNEFDCRHEYDWTCDECPINVDYYYQTHGRDIQTVDIDIEDLL